MRVLTLARRARDGARSAIRGVQLRRGIVDLGRTLLEGREPEPALMRQLVRSWGNEAWSAGASFLSAMVKWLPQTNGSIVECGSGLSTLILASAAMAPDRRVYSLEHDAGWASLVQSRMPKRLRERVSLLLAPLRNYGEFDWYGIDHRSMPASIGYVICDGPPGGTRGGRYGAGQVLAPRIAPGGILLLDDTQRAEERSIVERWCAELGGSVVQEGDTFSVIRIAGERSEK